jgi:hypothetical protein
MEMIRYCPECGHIGPIDNTRHIDCCPDGNQAVEVPKKVAQQASLAFIPAQPKPLPPFDYPDFIEGKAVQLAACALLEPVLRLWESDPHQFSSRPCATCKSITAIVGRPFGCECKR